jgi:hypothetical protein
MALKFYSGPATAVYIDDTGTAWGGTETNFGECSDISITWEPTGPETMDKKKVQTGGLGKFEAKAMQAGSTLNTALEGFQGSRVDIKVVVADTTAFIVNNVLLRFGFTGEVNDPDKTTVFDLMAQGWTDEPDDFCDIPTDPA